MDKDYYTRGEKEYLLKVARTSLEKFFQSGERFEPQTVNQRLWEKWESFVSLYKDNELKGRSSVASLPESLILSIRDNVISAMKDAGLSSLGESGLSDIIIEISILTEKGGTVDFKEGSI